MKDKNTFQSQMAYIIGKRFDLNLIKFSRNYYFNYMTLTFMICLKEKVLNLMSCFVFLHVCSMTFLKDHVPNFIYLEIKC